MILGEKWPIEAHKHHEVSRDSIYENKKISEFLDGKNVTLLVASKGMGKTLLMRVKKKLVMASKEGVTVIPSTDNEVDEPRLHRTFASRGFSSILLWRDLWSFSILLSILTHKNISSDDGQADIAFLKKRLNSTKLDESFKEETLAEIENKSTLLPSYYLAKLLHMGEAELQGLRPHMNVINDLSHYYIRSAVIVFVDAFDQTLTEAFSDNLEAWKNGQLGLAKAAHTLFTVNSHIKVLATIRQEAWAGFIDDDREVIKGMTLLLDYSESELKSMFIKAIKNYTKHSTVEGFLGVSVVQNSACKTEEDPFRYIFRHSTGTARSLMQLGKQLDLIDLDGKADQERMHLIRETINDEASKTIIDDYFLSQKGMFLKTLNDDKRLRDLLGLVPSNVLTASSLKSINSAFCKRAKISKGTSHPFCELFNCGLLGIVENDRTSGRRIQKFRKPYEFDWLLKDILRSGRTYLIHPGLINHHRTDVVDCDDDFKINRVNVIGCDNEWKNINDHDGIPKIFFSYSTKDLSLLTPLFKRVQGELDLKYPSDIWFDGWKITGGDYVQREVEHGVKSADILVLFASEASLNLKPGWVDREWRKKYEAEIESNQIRVICATLNDLCSERLPDFLKLKLSVKIDSAKFAASAKKLAEAISIQTCRYLEGCFNKT